AGAATLNYGVFLTNILDFIIIAWAIFIMIKQINRFKKSETIVEVTTKNCPYCQSSIHIKAVKCPHCTSKID
ncbi:MAG: MscL family protein, partial [Desulfitobacteriaceae bacterium]|nr:MscL family protein [Desulfitobacteriaceae bacterium]